MSSTSPRSGTEKSGKENTIHVRCTNDQRDRLDQIKRLRTEAGGTDDECSLSVLTREAIDDWTARELNVIATSQQSVPVQNYLSKPQRKDAAKVVFSEAIALRNFAYQQVQGALEEFKATAAKAQAEPLLEIRKDIAEMLLAIQSTLSRHDSRIDAMESAVLAAPSHTATEVQAKLASFEESITKAASNLEFVSSRIAKSSSLADRLESLIGQVECLLTIAPPSPIGTPANPPSETKSIQSETPDIGRDISPKPLSAAPAAPLASSQKPPDSRGLNPDRTTAARESQVARPALSSEEIDSIQKANATQVTETAAATSPDARLNARSHPQEKPNHLSLKPETWEKMKKQINDLHAFSKEDKKKKLILQMENPSAKTLISILSESQRSPNRWGLLNFSKPEILIWPLIHFTNDTTVWLVQADKTLHLGWDKSWWLGSEEFSRVKESLEPLKLTQDEENDGEWQSKVGEKMWCIDAHSN